MHYVSVNDIHRSSTVDLNCSSVQLLLSTPLAMSDATVPTSSQVDSMAHSSLVSSKITTAEIDTQTNEHFEVDEKLKLYKQLESITEELRLERTRCTTEKEQFDIILSNEQSKNTQLQLEIDGLRKEKEEFVGTKSVLSEVINKEKQELLKQLDTELIKITQLSVQVKHSNEEIESLKSDNAIQQSRLDQQETVTQNYQCEQDRLQQCVDELNTARDDLLTQLSDAQNVQSFTARKCELERAESSELVRILTEQVAKLKKEFGESQTEKDMLQAQANKVQDLASISKKLNDRELEIQQLNQELHAANVKLKTAKEQFDNEVKTLRTKCNELESKLLQLEQTNTEKQQQLESLHQVATKSLKSQLEKAQQLVENAQQKEKESIEKLVAIEDKLTSTYSLAQKLETSDKRAQEQLKNLSDKLLDNEDERNEILKREMQAQKDFDKLLRELEEKQAEQCVEIEDLKAQRDSYMKHAMEMERELKEHQRGMVSQPTSLEVGEFSSSPPKPHLLPVAASKVVMTVSIGV